MTGPQEAAAHKNKSIRSEAVVPKSSWFLQDDPYTDEAVQAPVPPVATMMSKSHEQQINIARSLTSVVEITRTVTRQDDKNSQIS